MPKRDISKPTFYLDSNVLIDLIELPADLEPARTIATLMAEADNGECNLVTSVLTIGEVLFAKHEIDRRSLDPAVESKLEALWHPTSSPIQLVDVHELIVRDATRLLRDHVKNGWAKTKGNDAIHLVTARREFADEFFTSENAMRKWGAVMGFKVCPAHIANPQSGLWGEPMETPPAASPVLTTPDMDVYGTWRLSKNRQLQSHSASRFTTRSLQKR